MQNKHKTISVAYHFICEAIIIFLLSITVMDYYFQFNPYFSYLFVLAVVSVLFITFSIYSVPFLVYLIAIPFIATLFYVVEFPIILSIAFALILTWRYLDIHSDTILKRETNYIFLTVFASVISYVLLENNQIILYATILFVILIAGYIISHLAIIKRDDRKKIDNKLWLYITGTIALGTAAIFLLFDFSRYGVSKLFDVFTYLFVFLASVISRVLGFVNVNDRSDDDSGRNAGMPGPGEETLMREGEETKALMDTAFPYIIAIVFVLGVIIISIMLFRLYGKKFKKVDYLSVNEAVTSSKLDKKPNDNNGLFSQMFGKDSKVPDHPVRKLVYQFERKAVKNNYGRYPFETLENWLKRIGSNVDLAVYQKVRYGNIDVSNQEIKDLRILLKEMEEKIDKKGIKK